MEPPRITLLSSHSAPFRGQNLAPMKIEDVKSLHRKKGFIITKKKIMIGLSFAIKTTNFCEGKPWLVFTRIVVGMFTFNVPYKALVIMLGSILPIRGFNK